MASPSQRPKGRDGVISTLDLVIQGLTLAKETCGFPPAQAALGAASVLLTMIRDCVANKQDYVDLGLACADVCDTIKAGLDGRQSDELSPSVVKAIEKLTATVEEIQKQIVERGKRHVASRVLNAKGDKDKIAAWRQELNRITQNFNTGLAINTHVLVTDIHRNAFPGQEGAVGRHQPAQASPPLGELPPPPPRACFGRDELIETIVGFAENLEPVALIGAGGIGKTSIALKVLHHDRIKQRFGDNRRFIRCNEFSASRTQFLRQLSKVIGARIENPEDLTPLRPFLSKMILFLDNAESILDPARPDHKEMYAMVEELTQIDTICLGITSRITTVPTHCERPTILPLSPESACDIFYAIYDNGGRSNIISDLVERLDRHALSITLLAKVASHRVWDYDRLAGEWKTRRAQVLEAVRDGGLKATLDLSLTSPTFKNFSPSPSQTSLQRFASKVRKYIPPLTPHPPIFSARELLEVVAFFPQGVNENNLEWLFPTIPDSRDTLDTFCMLSLTYRSNGFVTMLAPIRDHLTPKDPKSSPLLCATKDNYFSQLAVEVDPSRPGFEKSRWIVSEDVNVEHLLDVFTSIDTKAGGIWDACGGFMEHLYWHKPRQTVLGPKIEALSDDHPSKPKCLFQLSRLFRGLGNRVEAKRFLTYALKLQRQRGDEAWVAQTLRDLSDANRHLGLYGEGIQQAKEALEIYGRLGSTIGQALSLSQLASSLHADNQLDAAKDAASGTIDLLPEKGQEHLLCESHRILGKIYQSKGEEEKAISHFETALRIATPFNWSDALFWTHRSLASLFASEDKFDEANAHIERAKSHAVNDPYNLGRAMGDQALVWYRQGKLEDAKSEAHSALEAYEKLGAARDAGTCRNLLQKIERAMNNYPASVDPYRSADATSSRTLPPH